MKNPPKCPACGVTLTRVNATGKSVWVYYQGHYDNQDNFDATLSCPNCFACLDEVFGKNIHYWGIE